MAFHSLHYLAFLAACVLAYHAVPARFRWSVLFAASYAFYAAWSVELSAVLLGVTGIHFAIARRMGSVPSKRERRPYLIASLGSGLALLVWLKYGPAFGAGLADLLAMRGLTPAGRAGAALVPIGISFYTLQAIGYTLDVYHGRRPPERHFGIFAVFLAFFPIVVSGPIERSTHLLPQLQKEHRVSFRCANVSEGVKLIVWGLFLKLVIADRTAIYVNAVFGNVDRHSGLTLLAATVFYSFQIYTDFAGYSSVAIGSARLLGIDILENFRRPYLAASIREFWQRWHISLSTWLRDYLFLPLAYALSRGLPADRYWGIRVDRLTYAIATFVTFAACGAWHGVGWSFLAWGCLHGVYLIAEHSLDVRTRRAVVAVVRTYALLLVSWVFFRAGTVSEAAYILKKIVSDPGSLYIPSGADVVAPVYALLGIGALVMIELKREFYRGEWTLFRHRSEIVRILAYSLVGCAIVLMGVFDGGQFIYAQF